MNFKSKLSNPTSNIHHPTSKHGFTLIELLIYMGILAILIYVLAEVLFSFLDAQLSSQSTAGVAEDGRYIYSRLIYDINRAQSVSLPANLGDSSDTLNLVINAENYSYAADSQTGALQITDSSGTYNLNGPDTGISNLQFTRIGNVNGKQTFQVNFTLTSKIPLNGRFDSENFETVAGLR